MRLSARRREKRKKRVERRGVKLYNSLTSRRVTMTTAYHSAVLEHPVETVWQLIRDFNNYPVYIEGVTESVIEDGKRGDEVGAVRRFRYGDSWIRQRLSAHSDEQRSLTYTGIDPFSYPADVPFGAPSPVRYEGTMHLLPVVDSNHTFIEWSVALDTAPSQADPWRNLFLEMIPDWTNSLRRTLAPRVTEDEESGG
jgi:hypothetical protein